MPKKLPPVSVTTPPVSPHKVRLKLERSRLTFGDLEDIQDLQDALNTQGAPPLRKMRAVLARFVVDQDGVYLENEAANEAVRGVAFDEIGETFQQLARGVEQIALPPENSNA